MEKAIVINEKLAYKHMNGHTLEVNMELFYHDLSVDRVVLCYSEADARISVDFNFKNVLFCDVERIAQELYDAKNWGTPNAEKAWNGLTRWAQVHNVKLSPEYNCPA